MKSFYKVSINQLMLQTFATLSSHVTKLQESANQIFLTAVLKNRKYHMSDIAKQQILFSNIN